MQLIREQIPKIKKKFTNKTFTENPKLPWDIIFEVEKSFCMFNVKTRERCDKIGTGFFVEIDNSRKYLIIAEYGPFVTNR